MFISEPIQINHNCCQIPSKGKKLSFETNIEGDALSAGARLQAAIDKRIAANQDYDRYSISFESDGACYDDGTVNLKFYLNCIKIETPEQRDARVKRQEKSNENFYAAQRSKIAMSQRRKEYERILGHLEDDVLQQLAPVGEIKQGVKP